VPRERLLRQLGIARTLYWSGDRDQAAALFAQLEPQDSITVNVEYAEACLRDGDATAALARLRPPDRFADDARAQFVQARAFRQLGRDSEARRAAARAVELAPHESRFRDWLRSLGAPGNAP
jgi:Flp pilus assembly protein TadD